MSHEKRRPNPQQHQPEPALKAQLNLNQARPKCLAQGCGKIIENLLDGIYVVHRHEVAAFCSAGCLNRTMLQAAEQQYVRARTGKRDLLAALG